MQLARAVVIELIYERLDLLVGEGRAPTHTRLRKDGAQLVG
jgi:hypothetical protein